MRGRGLGEERDGCAKGWEEDVEVIYYMGAKFDFRFLNLERLLGGEMVVVWRV